MLATIELNNELVRSISSVGSRKLKFSRSLSMSLVEEASSDIDWISDRVGLDMLDLSVTDDGAVSSEADLISVAAACAPELLSLFNNAFPSASEPSPAACLCDLLYLHERSERLMRARNSGESWVTNRMEPSSQDLLRVVQENELDAAKTLSLVSDVLSAIGKSDASERMNALARKMAKT